MNCVGCNQPMDPALFPATTHPNCLVFEELDEVGDPFSNMIKAKVTEIIRWQESQHPRGHQVSIGPSEIGDTCDRRIGYRIAGVPGVNTEFDPWAAIVGTAVHTWLDSAVQAYMEHTGNEEWSTETALVLDDFIEGHSDLYNYEHQLVIDWKTAGPDVMRKVAKNGPSPGYMIQTHIYGYMFESHGIPVKKVALVFLPRAGRLAGIYVWSADYDRSVAENALARLSGIAQKVIALNVLTESHRWEQIDAEPSNLCGFCPWYDPHRDLERGADATGCPGR
jgi:hypothetical protein